jgi:uncharacterized membrane protein (UPF0127 family)
MMGSRGLVLRALVPETRRARMQGLRGRSVIATNTALFLERARSIHTFGIRLPISAVLLDRDLCVRSIQRIPPNRLLLPRPGIRHVLECAEGIDLRPGDRLRIVGPTEGPAGGGYTSRRCPRAGGGVRHDRAPIV